MYSSKENVNILTSLLVAHGVRHAVVCPGSRNSPIVHNLNECPDIRCYAVTDERSAGFYGLGMCQRTGERVVVCVTSGTALLNLAPAVAEAYYQGLPLTVISADRPGRWIDQLDGQTLPQGDALGRLTRRAVTLPEETGRRGAGDERWWHCNRLVNEALTTTGGPVHINVPIGEPLFDYDTAELPRERVIRRSVATMSEETLERLTRRFMEAKRPMLVCGQPLNGLMDEAAGLVLEDERYTPDFVLYTGGAIVSKRLKRLLRKAEETWAVNERGEVTDTFMNLTHVIEGDGEAMANHIRNAVAREGHPFVRLWEELLEGIRRKVEAYEPGYSQMAAVRRFEAKVGLGAVHYGNSMAIRLANIYAKHRVWCNRGVNGIEGSLSTAAGFSVVSEERVYCVIGDLSFFYDQNALWNRNLRGNLRILLLNNGCGGIFNLLKGLEGSPARDVYIAGGHRTTADGICHENDIVYLRADGEQNLCQGIDNLLQMESERPVVLEVVTSAQEDERVLKDYYKTLGI